MTKIKLVPLLAGILVFSTFFVGCGNTGDSTPAAAVTYGGPGSDYRIAILGTTVTITEADSGLNVNGTLSTMATGFSEIEITTVTDDGGTGVVVGDSLYAMVIPGVVTILKPAGSDQIVTAVPVSACPTADFSLNWISTKLTDPTTDDLFGRFAYTHATTTAVVTGFLASEGPGDTSASVNNPMPSVTCSSGIATVSDATMYLTQSGGALAKLTMGDVDPANDRFVVAMPSTTTVSGDLDDDYAGLIFTEGDDSFPAHATFSGSSMTFVTVNPDTGAAVAPVSSTETLTVSDFDGNGIGVLHGTLSGGEEVRCIADIDVNGSGKNLVFCVGQKPGGAGGDVFNALFVSR